MCIYTHTCVHICICPNMHINICQWIFLEENDVSAYENYLETQRTLKIRFIHCASDLHRLFLITDYSQYTDYRREQNSFPWRLYANGENPGKAVEPCQWKWLWREIRGIASVGWAGKSSARWCLNWRIHMCTAWEGLAEVEAAVRSKATREVLAGVVSF